MLVRMTEPNPLHDLVIMITTWYIWCSVELGKHIALKARIEVANCGVVMGGDQL